MSFYPLMQYRSFKHLERNNYPYPNSYENYSHIFNIDKARLHIRRKNSNILVSKII